MIGQPNPPKDIFTTRLHLIKSDTDDMEAETLFSRYTGNILASKYLQRLAHQSVEETKTLLRNSTVNRRFIWIIRAQNRGAIGLFTLILNTPEAEIHFGICPTDWGCGYATEAGKAVMRWVTDTPALKYVRTFCDAENIASMKVLEKIGLKRERKLVSHLAFPNLGKEKRDCWSYLWERFIES